MLIDVQKRKNEASLFLLLAFAVCSRCRHGTGCRDCEAINTFNDFVRFQTKWASTPSLPYYRLRLETNYELIIMIMTAKKSGRSRELEE